VIDWGAKTVIASEQLEDEPLSIEAVCGGRKVAVGTQEGVVGLYAWGKFGDVSDRITGHPKSVDAMAKLDEHTLITGSSDGLIRAVSLRYGSLASSDVAPCSHVLSPVGCRSLLSRSFVGNRHWQGRSFCSSVHGPLANPCGARVQSW
jgi:hypothetical protein